MPVRHAGPHRVKLHRIYNLAELAACCGVHKNTVRYWQARGLEAIGTDRPLLFEGVTVRIFLAKRKAGRKRPCPPGTFYCFRCRQPRPPALGMVEFLVGKGTTGNLNALCGACDTVMHRRAGVAAIAAIMPNLDVQIRQVGGRIIERTPPSLNCNEKQD
jgi:hypothetical protein